MAASLTYSARTVWGFRRNCRDQVAEHAQALADYLYEITAIRSTFPDSEDADQFNKQTVKLGSLIGAFTILAVRTAKTPALRTTPTASGWRSPAPRSVNSGWRHERT